MGFFSSLFGISDKENFGELIPQAPQLSLADGSVDGLTGGIQELIDTFTRRSQGQDQFDFIRFLFEPQLQNLNKSFGIDSRGQGDLGPLGRRQGALGRLEADLQRRGLFDTGSSGVLAAQLESDRAGKEAELFGQAKQLQRADIDDSLSNLNTLFPQLFEAQNIPNRVNFFNEQNQHGVDLARGQATSNQRQRRAGQKSSAIQSAIGLGANLLSGGSGGGFDFSNLSSLFGGRNQSPTAASAQERFFDSDFPTASTRKTPPKQFIGFNPNQ